MLPDRNAPTPTVGHFFISYARHDLEFVKRLALYLAQRGVDVWLDEDIPTGKRWRRVLKEKIRTSAGLILVMSPGSRASRWVRRETRLARRLKRPIFPLLFEGDIFPSLRDLQYENVRGGVMPSPSFVDMLRGKQPHRRAAGRLIGLIPPPADSFIHRDVEALTSDVPFGEPQVPKSLILSGTGGAGKTQAAAAIARNMLASGDLDLLVWASAQSRDAIVASFAAAANEVVGANPARALEAAKGFLSYLNTTTARWLIVLDDLAEPDDMSGLWPPQSMTGRVIVTTRRQDGGLSTHGVVVQLGMFTPAEAHTYLRGKFGNQPNRMAQSDSMAADLGYLPLALAQAAAYIVDADISCAEYRIRFADQRRKLEELTPEREALPDDYPMPLAATWALSVEAADRLAPSGLARPLLTLLSLLAPDQTPRRVITGPAVTDFLGWSSGSPADRTHANDALGCLRRLSLATAVGDLDDGYVLVHSLVQRATREQADGELVRHAAVAAAEGLIQVWPERERDRPLGQGLRASAVSLRQHAPQHLWTPKPHPVLIRLGESLGSAGHFEDAVYHYQALLKEIIRRLDGLSDDDPAARDLVIESFRVRENMANWCGEAGDDVAAYRGYVDLAAELASIIGPDHLMILNLRANAAKWQAEAGDIGGAVAANERLVTDLTRVAGAAHPSTLLVRANLARCRGLAGDPSRAVAELEALLPELRQVLGPDHPNTVRARSQLAHWLGKAGASFGAASVYEAVIADRERIYGPDHPETLRARGNLAGERKSAGDLRGAAAAYRSLLVDQEKTLGHRHPGTLSTRYSLAQIECQLGDKAGAVREFEALLEDFATVFGPDHPRTLVVRGALADARGAAGDPVGAARALEQVLVEQTIVLGADHPDTLSTRFHLANWIGESGNPQGAVAAYRALLADRVRVLGVDHPHTLATRHNLASFQGEGGDARGAAAAFDELVIDRTRVFGADHRETLQARWNAGWWRVVAGAESGDWPEAAKGISLLQALLADQVRIFGPDHPDTHLTARTLRRLNE